MFFLIGFIDGILQGLIWGLYSGVWRCIIGEGAAVVFSRDLLRIWLPSFQTTTLCWRSTALKPRTVRILGSVWLFGRLGAD